MDSSNIRIEAVTYTKTTGTDKAAFSDVFIMKTWSRPRLYIPLISRIHFSDPASIMDD